MLKLKNNKNFQSFLILVGITLALMSLMLLPGCSDKSELEDAPLANEPIIIQEVSRPKNDFREVYDPKLMDYLASNSIEHIFNEDEESEVQYLFEGLLNNKLQKEINSEITRRHQNLKYNDLPPYRGIRQHIEEDALVLESNTSTFQSFSAFNLLSVQTSIARSYPNKKTSNEPIYTTAIECYNVDLSTGEELKLGDLFADETDYKALINNYIVEEINFIAGLDRQDYSDSQIVRVYPFTGIKENQKFLLTTYDLQIIIDYAMPEFDTGFTYSIIRIPYRDLEGYLAIKERFYDDIPNIYMNPKKELTLIPYYSSRLVPEPEQVLKDGYIILNFRNYPKNLPPVLRELFLENSLFIDEYDIEINEENPENIYISTEYIGMYIGPYFKIVKEQMIHKDEISEFTSEASLYTQSGEKVELEDLFRMDYQPYEELINSRLVDAINQERGEAEVDFDDVKKSLSFSINDSNITFTSHPINFGNSQIHPLWFFIEFKDFGYENLVFFPE